MPAKFNYCLCVEEHHDRTVCASADAPAECATTAINEAPGLGFTVCGVVGSYWTPDTVSEMTAYFRGYLPLKGESRAFSESECDAGLLFKQKKNRCVLHVS